MASSPRKSLLGLVLVVLGTSAAVQWWHGANEARLGAAMAMKAEPGDIRMIASDTCMYCDHARTFFNEYHVTFSECSIERDKGCDANYRATLAPGTPVLVVRGKPQLGFDPKRVLEALG